MEPDKTEIDKKQKTSGIVFMFFPSFVSVYQRAGRLLCHQRNSISKCPAAHNCAELFDASAKKCALCWAPKSSQGLFPVEKHLPPIE